MANSNYNSLTPPCLSSETNFYLDTAVEYLASKGWSGYEDTDDNWNSRLALDNPGNVAPYQPTDAFLPNREMMVNSSSFQLQPMGLMPAQTTGNPHETHALLDASPPYCHSLETPSLDWRHQPSSSGESSLDEESRNPEQFNETFGPMRQWSSTVEMSQATHGQLAAAVGTTTTTKTSRRGAPHRHPRQFLKGDDKIRRKRDLNNEASQIYRLNKKHEKQKSQTEYQDLLQKNQTLHNDYNALEVHAQWCREKHGALQSYLPSMPPAPRPVSPFLPYAHQDAATLTYNET